MPGQRRILERLALPTAADQQRACPAATTTIRIAPVYSDLRPPPDDPPPAAPGGGTSAAASGTPYLLPALITVFTGDRITGADVVTLHVAVLDGAGRTTALCVA